MSNNFRNITEASFPEHEGSFGTVVLGNYTNSAIVFKIVGRRNGLAKTKKIKVPARSEHFSTGWDFGPQEHVDVTSEYKRITESAAPFQGLFAFVWHKVHGSPIDPGKYQKHKRTDQG